MWIFKLQLDVVNFNVHKGVNACCCWLEHRHILTHTSEAFLMHDDHTFFSIVYMPTTDCMVYRYIISQIFHTKINGIIFRIAANAPYRAYLMRFYLPIHNFFSHFRWTKKKNNCVFANAFHVRVHFMPSIVLMKTWRTADHFDSSVCIWAYFYDRMCALWPVQCGVCELFFFVNSSIVYKILSVLLLCTSTKVQGILMYQHWKLLWNFSNKLIKFN